MPAGAAGAGEPRLLVSDAMDLPCPGTRPPAWVLRAAWGTQHPAQAELLLLLRLAGALGLRRSRTGSGGGILLLFEGPDWRNQSGGGLRPRQGAWSVFLIPQSNTHRKGSHSQPDFFLSQCLSFSGEFHSNGL